MKPSKLLITLALLSSMSLYAAEEPTQPEETAETQETVQEAPEENEDASQEVDFAIEQATSVYGLIELADNVKPQYRYKVMNAIKTQLKEQAHANREEMIDLMTQTMEQKQTQSREHKASMLQSDPMAAMVTTKTGPRGGFNPAGASRGEGSQSSGMGAMGMSTPAGATPGANPAGPSSPSGGMGGGMR
ncbi:MAG: hypothetical protein U9N30_05440 [Campylobacterota bacterium]|nr:hypothetical protein [Campylobacterota bacterium]